MNYTKENCPVCGKQFTENDDIAVCPVCGTPHHRECYLERKECANTAKHAEGFEWTPSDEPQLPNIEHSFNAGTPENDKIVCPYCGRANDVGEPVCVSCGARLYGNAPENSVPFTQVPNYGNPNVVQIQPNDIIGGHTVADTAEFVQRNAEKYIPKFYKMERTGKKISFNWAAFLFSPYWFFYRKMNLIGAAFMIVSLAVSVLCTTPGVLAAMEQFNNAYQQFISGNESITQQQLNDLLMNYLTMPEMMISSAANFLLHLAAGIFGNYYYKQKVKKDISWVKESANSPEQYRILLFKRGGVSLTMVVLSAVGIYCLEQIISMVLLKIQGGGI